MAPDVDADRIVIDATGTDLRLPDGEYRLVPTEQLDIGSDDASVLAELAEAHGGVLFRFRDHVHDDWNPCVMLRAPADWSILELDGETRGIAGYYLAVAPRDDYPDEATRHVAAGFVVAYDSPLGRVWESEHWKLLPHPLVPRHTVRDWSWIWQRTSAGPISIIVRVANRGELERFVDSCLPMPYRPTGTNRYGIRREYALAGLQLLPGAIELSRNHLDPPSGVIAFDSGLLGALAGGALGPITWDVIDEDYEHLAAGEDGASLLDYLDPSGDGDAQRQVWVRQFAPRSFDGRAAGTPAELVAALSSFLGARPAIPDHLFDAWLAAVPLASLPRRVDITLSHALVDRFGTEWLFTRLGRAQPRLAWSTRVA